jgi:uncharacterized protein (TIGR02145 family)
MKRISTLFLTVLPIIGITGLTSISAAQAQTQSQSQAQAQSAQGSNYFAGAGGKGMRLAVLEPAGKGLSADEQWMLSLVQGSITADFNKFSAITVIDRQHVEKIMADIAQAMESGYYSDETTVKVGHMANARYVLTGVVTKTKNTYMFELAVTDAQSGVRKASYPPQPVSADNLENLSAVKAASADILKQLGVTLTGAGLAELKRPLAVVQAQAQAALAHGIAAQRRGTEVAALSYFYQAAALDTALLEAANRSSVISANITSGNIGADVRNDIAWRKAWVAKLTEAEEFFQKMINTANPPYSFFYSTDIQQGRINYQNETIELNILTNLRINGVWFSSIARAVNAVYAGLNATGRREAWGLREWPRRGVAQAYPLEYNIPIVFELVNEKNAVIGSQTLKPTPAINFSSGKDKSEIISGFHYNTFNTVSFNAVSADYITDRLAIRITSVDGAKPENARFQITALSGSKKREQTFVDPRNGRKYKAVEIFGVTWMAENLNYQIGYSSCYDNKPPNCDKYGMLYNWNDAMAACPAGWRLPTREEWKALVAVAGGFEAAGAKLKSRDWDGADDYGFSATPGGRRDFSDVFRDLGSWGGWWTATPMGVSSTAYYRYIKAGEILENNHSKHSRLSVRCVQD